MALTLIIILAMIAAVAFYVVSIYNRLVSLRNRYQNAFAQIEVQLKRRHDLIPNLVETAKGYLSHERETLQSVIEARNTAAAGLKAAAANPGSAKAIADLGGAEGAYFSAGMQAAIQRTYMPKPWNGWEGKASNNVDLWLSYFLFRRNGSCSWRNRVKVSLGRSSPCEPNARDAIPL